MSSGTEKCTTFRRRKVHHRSVVEVVRRPSGGVAERRSLSGGRDAGAPPAEAVALEPAQLLLELVAVLRCLEAGDPLLRGREGDAVAVLAGLEAERDRQLRL